MSAITRRYAFLAVDISAQSTWTQIKVWSRRLEDSLKASAIHTAWLFPWMATFFILASYLSRITHYDMIPPLPLGPVMTGVAYGSVAWLITVVLVVPFVSRTSANSRMSDELEANLDRQVVRCERLLESATINGDSAAVAACREANVLLEAVRAHLDTTGPQWVLGWGYLSAFRRIHQIDQVLIGAETDGELLADARLETLRLEGSTVPAEQKSKLIEQVNSACAYLEGTKAPPVAGTSLGLARSLVRTVDWAVDEFRNLAWTKLLMVRNRTLIILLLTESIACLLLVMAIILSPTPEPVAAGVLIFITGAGIGLFNRLLKQSENADVADYGLSVAKLRTLPVYSGLAAVAGVVIYAALSAGFTLVNAPADIATPAAKSIWAAFDLATNPTSLVVAALFALSPTLVTTKLGQLSEDAKSDIKSTSPVSNAST